MAKDTKKSGKGDDDRPAIDQAGKKRGFWKKVAAVGGAVGAVVLVIVRRGR